MRRVLIFLDFKFVDYRRFETPDEAHAYAHGVNHGRILARGPQGMLYVAILPDNEAEMAAIIPEDEIKLAWKAITE